jgi:prepilin-type N-terminal cleavage/methylation domain-containing protein
MLIAQTHKSSRRGKCETGSEAGRHFRLPYGAAFSAYLRPMRPSHSAFTLIELLMSTAILTVVFLALLSGYMGCLRINEMSRNTTIALEDARTVVEQMRSFSVSSLDDILSVDWTAWAVANGLNALDSEQVVVTYTDGPDTGADPTDDDPLDITVTVNWQDNGRPRSTRLGTLITVR